MRITSTLTVTGLLAAALLLAAAPAVAGGGGGGGACVATASGPQMTMLDNCFEGIAHEVEVDSTLTVTNRGRLPHTLTAVDGSFDSGVLDPGETFQVTVEEPGNIPVYCTLHGTEDGQGMAGVLLVDGPATGELASAASEGTGAGAGPGSAAGVLAAGLVGFAIGALIERRRSRRSVGAH